MSKYVQRRTGVLSHYPFVLLLCLLAAGIVLQQILPPLPGRYWLSALAATFVCSLATHFPHNASALLFRLRRFSLALTLLSLGAVLCYYQDIRHSPGWYGHELEHTEALAVQLYAPAQDKPRTRLLPVQVVYRLQHNRWQSASGRLNLYLYRSDSLPVYPPGTLLLIPNKLAPLQASGNPFGFNYARYAARNGIFHQAFISPKDIRVVTTGPPASSFTTRLSNSLLDCIHANVRDSTTRSLIAATLLNERASFDDTLWQAYSITGIVHIIAISGMHITLLFGILLFLLSWLRYKRYDWLKYLLALPFVWGYIMLTGFPPSAVRAAVGFTLVAAGTCLRREGNAINTWAATAFLLLCYNPYWLWDVGVQLSFLAVLSILLFYKPVRNLVMPPNKLLQAAWDTFAVSIAAQILVFPLVLYYFHQFPLLGLAASLPAALYSTLLMIGSLLLFLLASVFGSCTWLGDVLARITAWFHRIVLQLAQLTPDDARHLWLSLTDYWLMMAAVVGCCLFCVNRHRQYLYATLACCLLLCGSFIYQDVTALHTERLVIYNTARSGLADHFRGKSVAAAGLPGNYPVDPKTGSYTLLPARLGYRAITEVAADTGICYWKIGTKSVLYLKDDAHFKTGSTFPVDYLVVSTACRYRGTAWQAVFHPGMVILDGSLSRSKALRWKAQLQALGIKVHWVQESGAWILEGSI
ncbi:ComEC/Rec2 family competence protein [Taibaiella chishuiensis]|uniref:ComEC/Rec2-related protein n=1 Tax=Taibaiella chishuiensis TaxID=1434707 RepID=A0A2P8CYT1_9BACT|nr:ComEC/Rec2 family competence protein [Taibaiella chishuiensis]PSK90131.1 ComEC/Rec2-related protein [Taibaiella chishuiensis]